MVCQIQTAAASIPRIHVYRLGTFGKQEVKFMHPRPVLFAILVGQHTGLLFLISIAAELGSDATMSSPSHVRLLLNKILLKIVHFKLSDPEKVHDEIKTSKCLETS
jgi:hypothetical protein